MRLGMDLLRLSPLELTERLRQEAEANPLLIVEERPRSDDYGISRGGTVDVAELAVAATETLGEHLRSQLGTMQLSDEIRTLAEYLTETLDERGFLVQSRAEIAVETRFPLAIVDGAIEALTSCEPAGVGARTLQQCLALQLERQGVDPDRASHVVEAFEPLMTGDWPRAQALLGGRREELEALANQLYALEVEPARAFSDVPTQFQIPDILVERQEDGALVVALLNSWMPRVSIDRILRVQGQEDDRSREFVEERVRSAEALIRAISFRGGTLERIGQLIVDVQSPFFLGRTDKPMPMTRAQAARALDLHPSTVGRALRGRALEFDGRVYQLDWFFPRALYTQSGEELSIVVVQEKLRQLVSSEAPGKPLSDAKIAQRLCDEGVDISRRTVAKYRDAMNIPSSHIRRKLAARPTRRAT